jgi:hypothetical protein
LLFQNPWRPLRPKCRPVPEFPSGYQQSAGLGIME